MRASGREAAWAAAVTGIAPLLLFACALPRTHVDAGTAFATLMALYGASQHPVAWKWARWHGETTLASLPMALALAHNPGLWIVIIAIVAQLVASSARGRFEATAALETTSATFATVVAVAAAVATGASGTPHHMVAGVLGGVAYTAAGCAAAAASDKIARGSVEWPASRLLGTAAFNALWLALAALTDALWHSAPIASAVVALLLTGLLILTARLWGHAVRQSLSSNTVAALETQGAVRAEDFITALAAAVAAEVGKIQQPARDCLPSTHGPAARRRAATRPDRHPIRGGDQVVEVAAVMPGGTHVVTASVRTGHIDTAPPGHVSSWVAEVAASPEQVFFARQEASRTLDLNVVVGAPTRTLIAVRIPCVDPSWTARRRLHRFGDIVHDWVEEWSQGAVSTQSPYRDQQLANACFQLNAMVAAAREDHADGAHVADILRQVDRISGLVAVAIGTPPRQPLPVPDDAATPTSGRQVATGTYRHGSTR